MKRVILLLFILIFSSTTAYAEDVFILHQGYGNTHQKWKNRLEDAGHTVTMGNSLPNVTTSYEQIFDIRYSYNLSSAEETAYKALLARGGTLYLQGENPHATLNPRNQNITEFIKDELGGGNVVYNSSTYSGNSITTFNTGESYLANHSGSLTWSAGGILTSVGDGTWLAKDSSGNIVVAVWYGESLNNAYSDGIVFVFTDINYASHSSYYTNNNKAFMNALRTALASTFNQPTSDVTISNAQTVIKSAAFSNNRSDTGCDVCIIQSGTNVDIDIRQGGDGNFISDTDWDGPATLTGDNITFNITQGNVTTSGNSGDNGLGARVVGNGNSITVAQGDRASDIGGHRAIIDINGASNILNLEQKDYGIQSKHFFSLDLDGGSNNLTVVQKNDGQKTMFLDINGNDHTLLLTQQNIGLMYLDVTLSDSDHDVTITQKDQGDHAARVTLSGHSTDFDLIQQGNTDQSYELTNACSNALGCTINVTQGN